MAVGSVKWTGAFKLPASGPDVISSVASGTGGIVATDRVVCTPSYTSQQTGWYDINGPFKAQIVIVEGTGFTAYADRAQLPTSTTFDYIIYTTST